MVHKNTGYSAGGGTLMSTISKHRLADLDLSPGDRVELQLDAPEPHVWEITEIVPDCPMHAHYPPGCFHAKYVSGPKGGKVGSMSSLGEGRQWRLLGGSNHPGLPDGWW